jgi:MscS family membrane protein
MVPYFAAMLVPWAVKYFITSQLRISGTTLWVIGISLDVIFYLALIVCALVGMNRVAVVLVAHPRIAPARIDAQLIRLALQILGIVIAVGVVLYGGQELGVPLATLLAGAGVGGVAIALAAQDTLKNIFGSIMLFLDKPFRVGERIVVKGHDGVVKEIGLRSTRLALLSGHVTSIPNEEVARVDIENIGRRPFIRRVADLAIPLDTPLETVDRAVQAIRQILNDHEGMKPDYPPRVYFTDIARDALTIRVIYWYHPPAYWDYLAFSERFNRQVMQEFEALGIPFALPSTKTVLSR